MAMVDGWILCCFTFCLLSVCSIFRSGSSGTLQGSVREDSSSNTGRKNSGGPAARRKKTDFEDDISKFGVQLPPPNTTWKSSCQAESPSITSSGNSSNQRRGGRRRTWGTTASATLESDFLLPTYHTVECRKDPPKDAAHTHGEETLRTFVNITQQSQNPDNKIIHFK